MTLEDAVIVVGLIAGSFLVFAAGFTWIRHRELGLGGSTLCLFGFVLIGLTFWSRISFSVSATGITADIETLQQQVGTVAQATSEMSEYVGEVAANVNFQQEQMGSLADQLQASGTIDSRRWFQNSGQIFSTVDPDQVRLLARPLATIRRQQ